MIEVTAQKLKNHKVRVQGGYILANGWAVSCDRGIFTTDGETPHIFRSKAVAELVASGGLLEDAGFVK